MAHKAPGKHYRKGMSLIEIMRMFPDDKTAEAWFVEERWGGKICCPHCGSENVQTGSKHPRMPYRCREKECAKMFSVKTGTVMQSSKLGYQTWAIAIYLLTTHLKGVSSMKLHRDLEITQKSAWHLAHRLRESLGETDGQFSGPVESDETYMGGIRKNMSKAKRKQITKRGTHGKTAVVGAKDRATGKVAARVIPNTNLTTLQGFVMRHAEPGATIYTDEASSYRGLPYWHHAVCHSVGEYVRGEIHVNGVESFWSGLKRAHKGTFHKISPKHLNRYVQEFAGKHNLRELDTLAQMRDMVARMVGKRLKYRDLIRDNGLDSTARA
ncbi:MAG: IS1595 family transposase [Gammaproteobacteria bacterium]|nr:IS1595 family transposase [Gammaproteobacteria bacterium]